MSDAPHRLPEESRSARKRRAIMQAATAAFLENGYLGTSMDEIAARAAVSKQTVYKHFADKEALFAEILRGTVDQADELDEIAALTLQDSGDLEKDLGELARWLIRFLMQQRVRRLRRLVIGEAGRFPKLGRGWYEQGFERGVATLASCFDVLADRERLRLDDPTLAANHFAGLVLWVPVNRIMFCGDDEQLTDADVDRYATEGVRAFLAVYRQDL